ncbi:hypothetical protein F5Y17DRAFT_470947 [Xylariaceae sp. FL0594]|nr:hypothetical protein F5Y17DRAFT_470947 [Xylariaceae sp. FL0594]
MIVTWPPETEPCSRDSAQPVQKRAVPSLAHRAITSLVAGTIATQKFDPAIFNVPRQLPVFKPLLRRILEEEKDKIGHAYSRAQLIACAFEGEKHLDLTRFQELSATTIGTALGRPELAQVKAVTVCLQHLSCSVSQLASTLAPCDSISELYIVRPATRKFDQEVTINAREAVREVYMNMELMQHLTKVFVQATSQYFAPSSRSVFPIRTICQYNEGYKFETGWMFRNYAYTGWCPVAPENLVAKFLHWVGQLDKGFLQMVAGPPTLLDDDVSKVELIPHLYGSHDLEDGGPYAELIPGTWHLLEFRRRELIETQWLVIQRHSVMREERWYSTTIAAALSFKN